MRTSYRRSSSLGVCPHSWAFCQARSNALRVSNSGDCQRNHWPAPSTLRRAHATTRRPSLCPPLPRRRMRMVRPSQSKLGWLGCSAMASRSAPHWPSVICRACTSSLRCSNWVCARLMPSRPRQLSSAIKAIRLMATSNSIRVNPCCDHGLEARAISNAPPRC